VVRLARSESAFEGLGAVSSMASHSGPFFTGRGRGDVGFGDS
jgi:hypothetical protein